NQLGPAYTVAGHRPLRAEDVGQDHRRGTGAIAVDRADISAGQIEEAVDLALSVVETPGAGPAVGPAEDPSRAIFGVAAPQFHRDEIEGCGPGDRHELVAAAPLISCGAALEPPAPNHWPGDPRGVRHDGGEVAEQRRRIRVRRMRHDLDGST